MITRSQRAATIAALAIVSAQPVSSQTVEPSDQTFTAQEVRSDLDAWLEWTRSTHPQLAYSVDPDVLEKAAERISQALPETLSPSEAWRALATLNPVFNDAHIGLLVPPVSETEEAAVPLTISATQEGLFARSTPDGPEGSFQIHAFNGTAWKDIASEAMARLRGENEALRRFIIERRLHGLLRVLLPEGEIQSMTIQDSSNRQIEVPVDPSRLRFLANDAGAFGLSFTGNTAELSVPSFARDREEEFTAFLESAFATIAERGSDRLVIDISENGGGAHDLSDQLMAYLTDKPYAATSAVTARITRQNQALIPGSKPGDVLTVPFAETVTPAADLAHRFDGDVSIKLGAKSYSQAIVFAATAQDMGVARLVGEAPRAPANQTGQVQTFKLPNTGFTVRAPIYIIYRGSGDRSRAPLAVEDAG